MTSYLERQLANTHTQLYRLSMACFLYYIVRGEFVRIGWAAGIHLTGSLRVYGHLK